MNLGDSVIYVGGLAKYNGVEGVIVRLTDDPGAIVQFPSDSPGGRFFSLENLRKVNKTMSIVSRLNTAIAAFIGTATPSDVKATLRELIAASRLATIADASKKRCKKRLIDLNVSIDTYRPGTVTLYEDTEFLCQAVTKEPASRLDQAVLTNQLRTAGLSQAKITAAISAATVENKPATSITVMEK